MSALDVATTISSFPCDEWDALVERSGAPVFYRHAMLLAYERAPLQKVSSSRYVSVRDGRTSELLAALPLYLVTRTTAGGDSLAAVTHAAHFFETCALADASADGELDALWDGALAAAREAGASVVAVANVHDGGDLASFLRGRGHGLTPLGRAFALDLSRFRSFDDYLASLRRSARKDLVGHSRRAEADGAEVFVEAPPRSVEEAVAMCRLSAGRHGNVDWYPEGPLATFCRRAAPLVRLVVVRHEDRVVAAQICFFDSDRLYAWATGADYGAGSTFSASYPCWGRTVELAFGLGARRIEAGRRNERFKARFGLQPVDLLGCVVPVGAGPA